MTTTSPIIITIDGPSGSGKGTLAQRLAEHYGYQLLDSGAMYRLLGLALHQRQLLPVNDENLAQCEHIAQHLNIDFKSIHGTIETYLDGELVTQQIRTEEVGGYASQVASIPSLRQALLARQQAFAQGAGLVADGRDMGTVVFPNAIAKLYLTASAQARAERRVKQLQQMGKSASIDEILAQIQARDERDMARSVAPLKPADDAYIIDSSQLNIDDVFALMTAYITQRIEQS
ncbi:MAG: (d)CMP kinase [Acinetobacter sp.]|nr:(d)CMP kinase [Acinetobacter sp.]